MSEEESYGVEVPWCARGAPAGGHSDFHYPAAMLRPSSKPSHIPTSGWLKLPANWLLRYILLCSGAPVVHYSCVLRELGGKVVVAIKWASAVALSCSPQLHNTFMRDSSTGTS